MGIEFDSHLSSDRNFFWHQRGTKHGGARLPTMQKEEFV